MPKKKSTMTKSDAMREVFASGIDKPTAVVVEVKKRFGLRVTPQTVSSFKFQEGKKKGGTKRRKKAVSKKSARNKPRRKKAGVPADTALFAAADLIRESGSAEQAKRAIETVEKIRSL